MKNSHLDFSILISGLDMITTIDKEPNKLSGTGTSQLSRIVLLLDQASLRVDHQAQSTNFLSPIDRVTLSIQEDQQSSVGQRASTN